MTKVKVFPSSLTGQDILNILQSIQGIDINNLNTLILLNLTNGQTIESDLYNQIYTSLQNNLPIFIKSLNVDGEVMVNDILFTSYKYDSNGIYMGGIEVNTKSDSTPNFIRLTVASSELVVNITTKSLSDYTNNSGGESSGNGKDGITPQLKIGSEDNYWYVSYDNGSTWESLGVKATGEDGQDGKTPIIGAEKDTDGVYYWTVDGEWLTDSEGNKIKAQGSTSQEGTDGEDGKDGITPQLKIENGKWYVSYDEGNTWTELGQATGEDGQDGNDGDPGKDGITPILKSENAALYVSYDNGTSWTYLTTIDESYLLVSTRVSVDKILDGTYWEDLSTTDVVESILNHLFSNISNKTKAGGNIQWYCPQYITPKVTESNPDQSPNFLYPFILRSIGSSIDTEYISKYDECETFRVDFIGGGLSPYRVKEPDTWDPVACYQNFSDNATYIYQVTFNRAGSIDKVLRLPLEIISEPLISDVLEAKSLYTTSMDIVDDEDTGSTKEVYTLDIPFYPNSILRVKTDETWISKVTEEDENGIPQFVQGGLDNLRFNLKFPTTDVLNGDHNLLTKSEIFNLELDLDSGPNILFTVPEGYNLVWWPKYDGPEPEIKTNLYRYHISILKVGNYLYGLSMEYDMSEVTRLLSEQN